MKMRSHPVGFSAALAACLLVMASPAFRPSLFGQGRPNHAQPDFDKRAPAAFSSPELARRQNGRAHLNAQLPSVKVDFDELLGTPKFVCDQEGFLTGPNGQGKSVSARSAQALSVADPYRPVKAFLNEHSALFGHGAEALEAAKISRESVGAHNGLRTVVWQQRLEGIPVFDSVLIGNVTKDGELVSLASQFLPDLPTKADAGTPNRRALQASPSVSPESAILKAAESLGQTWSPTEVVGTGAAAGDGYLHFKTPRNAYARQVWLPADHNRLRLCWEVILNARQQSERYQVLVDAETGEPWLRRSLTWNASDVTFNVYTSDSPSPFSPGWSTPNLGQPPLTNRVMVTISANGSPPTLNTNASPNGWIDDGNDTTTGNNADAFTDRNFDFQPDGPRPQGNGRVFDFPLDLTQDPLVYSNAATVQMFYYVNWYHDRLYELGFTEAAGNYQETNFNRGGVGGDSIICYVQSGADVGMSDNAFFSGAPDGINGEIAMFTWNGPSPHRDGDLDADVVFHEATHGTSMRLVGGGAGMSALQTRGLGEGWSDFYSMCLLSEPGDNVNGAYPPAGYAAYKLFGINFPNYYYSDRHFPYCTDMSKNPFTFKDIDPNQISSHPAVPRSPIWPFNRNEASEVHHQGEIWCITLWEVRANLVNKYGFAGNRLMLQMATDAMKLCPVNPNFLQARDALFLADRVNNGGANIAELWRGFAKRGLGLSARSPSAHTTVGVVEAFDTPGLQLDRTVVLGGNGNGIIEPNECDDLQITIFNNGGSFFTGISGHLSTTTPGVMVVQPDSAYANLPSGVTNANLSPFRISVAPTLVCGTPIDFNFILKSDQMTSSNQFRLYTGLPGTPVRFDSYMPVTIPDGGETNSPIVVSNIASAVNKVTVGVHISHTWDADLLIQLVAPDGTISTLSANNGSGGDNYGLNCGSDAFRTTFDDAAATPISGGVPPFLGPFKPDQPLAIFAGRFGTNINGTWKLRVADQAMMDQGTIQCWSLNVTPVVCTDGGGECPGSDMAVAVSASPEPVIIGNYLTYSILVTNNGPSAANSVSVSQLLPANAIFVSAVSTQGSCAQAGGLVTCNLGPLAARGRATITVVVLPATTGFVSSSVSVSSEQVDYNLGNNSAVAFSHVNPVASELAVGIAAAPASALVGGSLTYTVTVTNNGPSAASGVTVTNVLPASFAIQSVPGSASVVGNLVIWPVGALASGARASAAIVVSPTAEGTFAATAIAAANQNDPFPPNNSASVSTLVGPSADLSVTLVDMPDPVVQQGQLTYKVTVANAGPSTATAVVLNGVLPASVTVASNYTSQGSVSLKGNLLFAELGSIPARGAATVVLLVTTDNLATNISASVNVAANEADPVLANNAAACSTQVSPPFVNIVPAGATLVSESFAPPNGAIDIGETVTLDLRLVNAGNIKTKGNLMATLLAGNGVTPIAPATTSYGIMAPSGAAIGLPFSLVASGVNGGAVTATLQVQDSGGYSTNVTFTFALPQTFTFSNTNRILVPDTNAPNPPYAAQSGPAAPYPSTLTVSGIVGQVSRIAATLSGVSHTYAHDINVLLVSPLGDKAMLLSHAGGEARAEALDLTFDDAAAAMLPEATALVSGSWKPSVYNPPAFPTNASSGLCPASLQGFAGADPNGQWKLYLYDDSKGDVGEIAHGWSLAVTTITPINQSADVGITAAAPANAVPVGDTVTQVFTVTNLGPATANNVSFSGTLDAAVALVAASSSAGWNLAVNGNQVTGTLSSLTTGEVATVTVAFRPLATGWLTNTASVSASEVDLHSSNNSLSLAIHAVSAFADLDVSQAAAPDSVLSGSAATLSITVTNGGTNAAVNVLWTNVLPANLGFLAASATAGACTNAGNTVFGNLGTLEPGAAALITISASALSIGTGTNLVSVLAASSVDLNLANNSSALEVRTLSPIVAAGVVLRSESLVNGVVDPGETVTVSFALENQGPVNLSNVVASLQATGGITPAGAPQHYGLLLAGGASVSREFTFTAGAPAAAYVATLQLQDGTNNLGAVAFAFTPPSTTAFASSAAISIPDHGSASPYPAAFTVSGVTGLLTKVTVTLEGLTHRFPADVNALLVSPAGNSVVLMSHTGGGHPATNVNLTFDDAAGALPASAELVSGTYKPTSNNGLTSFPGVPAPYGATLAAVNGASPNGLWRLYVYDDQVGDFGYISSGWSLQLTTVQPINSAADLAVTLSATPGPLFTYQYITNVVTVTNRGPAAASTVALTYALPAGLTVVSATASQGTVGSAGGTVTYNVGALPLGAGATATLRLLPTEAGKLLHTFVASSLETDINPENSRGSATTSVLSPRPAQLAIAPYGNQFELSLTAEPGLAYSFQSSTNLASTNAWTIFHAGTVPANGIMKYRTIDAQPSGGQFYRAVRSIP